VIDLAHYDHHADHGTIFSSGWAGAREIIEIAARVVVVVRFRTLEQPGIRQSDWRRLHTRTNRVLSNERFAVDPVQEWNII